MFIVKKNMHFIKDLGNNLYINVIVYTKCWGTNVCLSSFEDLSETQAALSRIWTRVTYSISNENNRYTYRDNSYAWK